MTHKRKHEKEEVIFGYPIVVEPPKVELPACNLKGMKPIHENLPQPPFSVGIIGPRNSGKSVVMYNMLSPKPGMYGHAFRKKNILFFSPTADKDPTMDSLKLKNCYNLNNPGVKAGYIIDYVRDKQQAFKKIDDMSGVLMAFDDITQMRNVWVPLEDLGYTGRHDGIMVLYVAHKMSSIFRGIRTQTQQWLIFKPHEESEVQWVLDMFSRKLTRHIWDLAIHRAWRIPHNFIYIDFSRKGLDQIYRSGFNDPLFTDSELSILSGDALYFNPEKPENPEANPVDVSTHFDKHLPKERKFEHLESPFKKRRKTKKLK